MKIWNMLLLFLCLPLNGWAEEIDLTSPRGLLYFGTNIEYDGLLGEMGILLDKAPDGKALEAYLMGRILSYNGWDNMKLRGVVSAILLKHDESYFSKSMLTNLLSKISERRNRHHEISSLHDDLTRIYLRKFATTNNDISMLCIAALANKPDVPKFSLSICARAVSDLYSQESTRNLWIKTLLDPQSQFTEETISPLVTLINSDSPANPNKEDMLKILAGTNWPLHLAIMNSVGRFSIEMGEENGIISLRQQKIVLDALPRIKTYDGLLCIIRLFSSIIYGIEGEKRSEAVLSMMSKYIEMRGEGLFSSDEKFSANQKTEIALALIKEASVFKDESFKQLIKTITDQIKEDLKTPNDFVSPSIMFELIEKVTEKQR